MCEHGGAMKAIDVIHDEHRVIRDFIDKVQISLELLAKGEHPPRRFFELAVQFTKDYIERFHHFKEELVLFVKLAERMGGKIDAHIDSLREQHNRSRFFISEVIQSLEGYEKGNQGLTNNLFSNFGYYTSLERAHLNRENHVFIPLISQQFSDAEQEEFVEIFRQEERHLGEGYLDDCMAILGEMTQLLETQYMHQYKYLLDSVSSKRVRWAAA
jgi:hemerythrin-like domain-containing protein